MASSSRDGWNVQPDQPRVCAVCGDPVTMKTGGEFKRWPVAVTFHHACTPKWKLEQA